ncbi:MAG: argininosuccinate lyase [Candidatus Latescibacterota bacterium]|nr:argininosuccinate lyase [Candidatus Latescibacterota bacterium]
MSKTPDKPWGGRFGGATDRLMERFNASIGFDRKLYRADIEGSRAQSRGLVRAGILTQEECDQVIEGLNQVEDEIERDELTLTDDLEDIHMAVEKRLTEIVGSVGGKIHTGRSRNDQVALDERLFLREAVSGTMDRIAQFQDVLLASAEKHIDAVIPGYTHLQQAQPLLFSHYAMSLFWMIDRDWQRFRDCGNRADSMPLGSGALAGSAFPIDRDYIAEQLGFSKTTPNSIDAVSDRDSLIEFASSAAILMMHLSRFCEDLIIWSSSEFAFVELDDAFSTGSSMMPQKKNPDSLELVRGKTGRVYGNLVALLTVMKGIPLSYSKDMQEDKEPLFDTVETVWMSLEVFASVWDTMTLKSDRTAAALDGMILATDLADYLARKGVPFRECHHIVGGVVKRAIEDGIRLESLSLETLKEASEVFGDDVREVLSHSASTDARDVEGGTSRRSVEAQIEKGKTILTERSV